MEKLKKPGQVGFRVIGVLKLGSGTLALVVGIGVVRYLGQDPGQSVERLITHLRLDPNNLVIHTVINAITGIDRTHLRAIELGTFFYALLHIIEGTGLILKKDWAGYLVIVATSSLVPFEIYEIARKVNLLRIRVLLANLAIVIYLIVTIRREHRAQADQSP
jgi:uncharacterized membrane protein (DUF2068 family)